MLPAENNPIEPEISGYLKIRRGHTFVDRYAEINNAVLFYYKNKGLFPEILIICQANLTQDVC
jgi:hypothetical protein